MKLFIIQCQIQLRISIVHNSIAAAIAVIEGGSMLDSNLLISFNHQRIAELRRETCDIYVLNILHIWLDLISIDCLCVRLLTGKCHH